MLQPARSGRRSRAGPVLGAAAFALLLLLLKSSSSGSSAVAARALDDIADPAAAQDSPWPKTRVIEDLEALWEVPAKPKGVLFVAHGCNHQGSDFFPPSDRCQHCLGLPEEQLVRRQAIKSGYAVVAVTSFNRDSKCWHNTQASRSEDLKRLPKILKKVLKEEKLQGLPLYVFGASSGGGIVLRLAAIMPEVQGVIAQITPVRTDVLEAAEQERGGPFPPVLFVHMAQRDPEKAEAVTQALEWCKKAGIPAAEIKVDPQPVTTELLQRSTAISAALAKDMVAALQEHEFIDEAGYLFKDPRGSSYEWRQVLQPVVGDLSLEPDVSQVNELLNVAYARHEIVSDFTDVSLAWLEAGGKQSIDALLEQEQS